MNYIIGITKIGDNMVDSIEVHIISNRPKLDEFIHMWENVINYGIDCTIKVLTLDYPEKKFILNNGIKVEYIKQKTVPNTRTNFMNQAWARNELLCYANLPNVLFYDDWQRPEPHILFQHLEYLNKGVLVCGRRLSCDKDGLDCKEDSRYINGIVVRQCSSGGEFWTCNGSVNLDNVLKVNGFDNRFNGGSAGEDVDFGVRVSRLGVVVFYNGNAICWHYNHSHLGSPCRYTCGYSHITSDYKYIPQYKHFGKWENMDGGDKYELWWEGPIKYYKCKICNGIGILDSVQVLDYNRDHHIIRCENGLEQVREALKKVIG